MHRVCCLAVPPEGPEGGRITRATADKTGDALAIVSGVKNYDDMLKAEVKAVSAAAAALGVAAGMSGKEALAKLA